MPTRQHYQQIVEHFEEAVRANLSTLVRVADVSEAIAISQRTLSRAVRVVHGTTPFRFVRSLRLAEARKALLSADWLVGNGYRSSDALRLPRAWPFRGILSS